jgi:hypothetical protein
MDILPLKYIHTEDAPLVGEDLVRLACLKRLNLPVPEAVVVFPPILKIQTILKHYEYKNKDHFEQALDVFKESFFNISYPDEFEKILGAKKLDYKKVWRSILQNWLDELRSNFWRQGFVKQINHLSAQPVFFTGKIKSFGRAYFDYQRNKFIFEVENGKLGIADIEQLESLVKKADKKLYLPFVYSWVLEDGLKIVKISPFTQSEEVKSKVDEVPSKEVKIKDSKEIRSGIKVFLEVSDKLHLFNEIDGVVINNKAADSEYKTQFNLVERDFKMLQLTEAATTVFPRPVLYKLPDRVYQGGNIRGALNLIHNKSLLQETSEVIKFAFKKSLTNVEVVIPYVRSPFEMEQLLGELDLTGLKKGVIRIILEINTPENLINIKNYIEIGLSGVIINLNELIPLLGGFNTDEEENLHVAHIETLLDFLKEPFINLHAHKIPIMVSGDIVLQDDLLRGLIKKGVIGIVVSDKNILGVKEQLSFLSKLHLVS